MTEPGVASSMPTRARMIVAGMIVLIVVAIVWGVINYRMRPPPPPHKIGERVELK